MFRSQSWLIICSFVILAIAITGICLAVTPVAASALQATPIASRSDLATNLHTEKTGLNAPPPVAQMNTQPSTDGCLLCYSPSHILLTRLTNWMH